MKWLALEADALYLAVEVLIVGEHGAPSNPAPAMLSRGTRNPSGIVFVEVMKAMVILVVDDNPHKVRALAKAIASRGHAVITARSATEALALLAVDQIEAVIADHDLGDGTDGAALLSIVAARDPNMVLLLYTGRDDVHPTGVRTIHTPAKVDELLAALGV
jgi:ActR/RegA family two-component response regulator